MSEYWVSHKKYFCKYCNIYIADDAPSRSHHESGLRHKGNVERFVRGLYKTREKKQQDLEEEEREMVRVERTAQAAFARDVSSGLVKLGSGSGAPPASKQVKEVKKSSNPYDDYSTPASLGYNDPDAERLNAEAMRRNVEGVAGDWEVVVTEETPAGEDPTASNDVETSQPSEVGQKRPPEPADEEDARTFKLRRKKMGVGLGEIYDPGVIPIKLKAKKETPNDAGADEVLTNTASSSVGGSSATSLPKWTSKGWMRPNEGGADLNPNQELGGSDFGSTPLGASPQEAVKEEQSEDLPREAIISAIAKTLEVKQEEEPINTEESESSPATSSMFRKRKIRGGGTGGRGRIP